MRTAAYRVREVLSGHSSTAAIIAVDTEGREVRLEVGALEGASIQVDEVLVLSWATVQVPQTASSPKSLPEDEPLLGRSLEDVEVPAEPVDSSDLFTVREIDEELKEIQALMGLQ